jgi:mono/diheme cytochrome c family protein
MFARIHATVPRRSVVVIAAAILIACLPVLLYVACSDDPTNSGNPGDALYAKSGHGGQQVFRYDTFGDEEFWTGVLHMDDVIESSVDPTTALRLGLKVDADALPPGLLESADLTSPATTVALLKLNAVVGIQAKVDAQNHIVSLGVTCALCHSTVDNSVMPGIGHRKDGWPNHDLDVGKIIASSAAVPSSAKEVYNSWGPGMYDPRFNIDGLNTPLVIPPAYGLAGIKNETYTADGPISYWNAYVAVTQMHGHGTFIDPRLGISVVNTPDMVTPKLRVLLKYQLSLKAPAPPAGSFDVADAEEGDEIFEEHCESCHVDDSSTDNNAGVLHDPNEIGTDPAYAARTLTKMYRTTPLRGLWQHAPYFHDGSAATLEDVVAHYNSVFNLGLNADEQHNLVEYLKTL